MLHRECDRVPPLFQLIALCGERLEFRGPLLALGGPLRALRHLLRTLRVECLALRGQLVSMFFEYLLLLKREP